MKHFAIICTVATIAAVFLLQGSFLHQIIAWLTTCYIGGPALLFLSIALLLGLKNRAVQPWVWKELNALSIFIFLLGVSVVAGTAYGDWQQKRGMKYVVNVAIPALEKMKAENGRYPESLPDELVAAAPMGSHLPQYQARQDDSYQFYLPDRSALIGGFMLTEARKEWVRFD